MDFFKDGYEKLLSELSLAFARSVILSGDKCELKLSKLRESGFSGLGKIYVIDVNRAIFIAFLVYVFALSIFFVAPIVIGNNIPERPRPFIFVISASIILAVVVGAMVGGLRRFAESENAPFLWYAIAAILTAIAHVIAVFMAVSLNISIEGGNPNYSPIQFSIAASIVPASLVLGLCWQSRKKSSTSAGLQNPSEPQGIPTSL
ncbi:MAG: hypothetical protein RIF39_08030 [Cyclobacteriaceae bacterium]